MNMKKFLIKAFSAVVSALMLFGGAAFARSDAVTFDVPEGYDSHDYEKAVAFLEQTDASGVKNGMKLSVAYDPLEPESWNAAGEFFFWTESEGVLKLSGFSCPSVQGRLFGTLDLSGCAELSFLDCSNNSITALSVSGCSSLDELVCKNNSLTALSVSGCSSLRLLNCANNSVAALDLSDCGSLRFLECRWNRLSGLDLSACPGLTVLICTDNRLRELDLSNNPLLGCVRFLRMVDSGQQFISCYFANDPEYSSQNEYFISADCYEGCSSFAGWFTEDGRLVGEHTTCSPDPSDGGVFIARFTIYGPMPGDADENESVNVADALLILRASMGLVSGNTGCGFDVNGDGAVNVADALLILRRSMGLFG